MYRLLLLAAATGALALPASADVPAHGTFTYADAAGSCVEVTGSGTQDCLFGSFTVPNPPPPGQGCITTLPAALTVTTGAFGGMEITLYGELTVADGAGAFRGATDPAHQLGVVAVAELAYAGPVCASGQPTLETTLAGSYDVIGMIPI